MRNIALLIALSIGYTSSALADTGAGAVGQNPFGHIIFLGGFILIFYFLLIRPQSKRHKEQQALIKSIAKDDEVITAGGIIGRVLRVSDQFLVISIAEGIEVKVQRHAVSATLPRGTMKDI
ncbi:MAG: preprotein translocase subunit YajC [Candidatus Berkiella sp.]